MNRPGGLRIAARRVERYGVNDTQAGSRRTRRARPLGLAALALLAALPVSFFLMLRHEAGSVVEATAYVTPVAISVALMAAAVPRVPAQRRRPWLWLMLAMGMFFVGEIAFAVLDVMGNETWPTPADAIYLAAYVPTTIGMLGLNRQRGGATHRGSLLDASIVTLSAATLFGVFVVLPIAHDGSQTLLAKLVASAYPLADVVLVFLLARMLTGPAARTAAFWLLSLGTVATLVADVGMTILQFLEGGDSVPPWMSLLWLVFYACLALAACSESAARPGEKKKPRDTAGLTIPRLALLAVAAILPSGALFVLGVAHRAAPTAWLALGSVVLVGLVVTRIWDLLQQLRSQAAQLAALARTDPLTGAANRRTWDHEVSRACALVRASGEGLYVALLDLDHFKAYNDAFGHQAGDSLLKSATAAWSEELDGAGFLARWGGEEFAVLLRSRDEGDALHRLDALRTLVPDAQTCSIGVARWDGAEEANGVLRRADEALYAAKTGGRNRLVATLEPVPAGHGRAPAGPTHRPGTPAGASAGPLVRR